MTRKEFQDGMNSIQVDGETREQLWSRLCEKQSQRTDVFLRKAYFRVNQGREKSSIGKNWAPVVAILLICIILIPGIVYADEIVHYFRGHLSQSPKLASNVNQSVFRDEDEHVSMEVCELLSDGYATCMTVKYTAHDKKGREWLFGDIFQDVPPMYREEMHSFNLDDVLCIAPLTEENENEMRWSGSNATREIAQEQTKKSRIFSLEYTLDDESSKRCLLRYPLFGTSREKALTYEKLLETYTYALDGECNAANYTPKYLRISKIGYVVYGENQGIYQRDYRNPGIVTEKISDEDIDSATLYFKKRSALDLIANDPDWTSMGDIEASDATCNMDLRVLRGGFYGQAEWIPFEDSEHWYEEEDYGEDGLEERIDHRLAIDPEDVQKIEINGDLYALNRVD